MANTVATVPSKQEEKFIEIMGQKVKEGSIEYQYLSKEFDPLKKYMFELATKVPERTLPVAEVYNNQSRSLKHRPYNNYQNIVYTSQIVFNGQRVGIRYYDGCDTIFISGQPSEKDTIELLIRQTKRRAFLEGKFGVFGDEKMLLLYLMMCSWNADSPFRTRTADQVFVSLDRSKTLSIEAQRLEASEKALQLAKEATNDKMFMHGAYLGIALQDEDSGNELTPEEFRIEYRKRAIADPMRFVQSYANKKIEIEHYINKAWEKGLLNNKLNPNKVMMGEKNVEICDISGLRSPEAICQRIYEYASSSEGEEFCLLLKAAFS